MAIRVYPINSPESATVAPGINDFDLLRIETNLLEEGVLQNVGDAFAVVQRAAGANLSVDVGSGLALIEITNTNVAHQRKTKTWFESTGTVNKVLATADATNPRKDRVILRVDVETDPDEAAENIGQIEVLTGTPAGSPSAPAVPDNAISLAIIDVPAGDTAITNNQITDTRAMVTLETGVLADVARVADLASTEEGKGADMIGVDAEGIEADTLTEALEELKAGFAGLTATKMDVFTENGTWTKPEDAKLVRVILVGGGGGGAGGGRWEGNGESGGGGGSPGSVCDMLLLANAMGATAEIIIGQGGTGGAGRNTNGTGNPGQDGGNTTCVTAIGTLYANGGLKGNASTGGAARVSNLNSNLVTGSAGGNGGNTAPSAPGSVVHLLPTGGGGGAGTSSGNQSTNGAAGGAIAGSTHAGWSGNAVAGGAAGGSGGPGGNGNTAGYVGTGGGGGFGSYSGTARAGGNGGLYGGGGGGGGAHGWSGSSAAGGNGAQGIALIISYS